MRLKLFIYMLDKKLKKKQIYSLRHNILELYNVLVQIRLTTSKTKRDI